MNGNGNAELQETKVVVYVVQDGEATVLNGGKLVDPVRRTDDPRRWRGSGLEGSESYTVRKGDVFGFPTERPTKSSLHLAMRVTDMSCVIDVE